MGSQTARSMKLMRDRGYPLVEKVEAYQSYAKRYKDLFQCWDIICVSVLGQVVVVQTTSDSNVSARVNKIIDAEATPFLRKAGWTLLVHGWRKRCNKWTVRELDVS